MVRPVKPISEMSGAERRQFARDLADAMRARYETIDQTAPDE